MSDPTTSLESPEPALEETPRGPAWQRLQAERDELKRELDSRSEEVLRLRDLLIGRDAELGAARGQLQMIEDNSKRVTTVADRIPIPGAGILIGLFMRLISGRRG